MASISGFLDSDGESDESESETNSPDTEMDHQSETNQENTMEQDVVMDDSDESIASNSVYSHSQDYSQHQDMLDDLNALGEDPSVITAETLITGGLDYNKRNREHLPSVEVECDAMAYDLGNLCAYDPADVDIDAIFKDKKPFADSQWPQQPRKLTQSEWEIRQLKERALYDLTRNNMQALSNALYKRQPVNLGPAGQPGLVVKLPPPRTRLPRQKPMPTIKPPTKWDELAARKNIKSRKHERNAAVWDEATQGWRRQRGYKRVNDPNDNPIFEHKSNDFSTEDPWKLIEQKKKKHIKNLEKNRQNNLRAAYGDRLDGTLDMQSAMNYSKNKNKTHIGRRFERFDAKQRNKGHLQQSLKVAQHSTASMGKFDKLAKNEPKPKLKANRKKSVGYMQSNENTKVHQFKHGKDSFGKKERTKQKEILYNIFGKKQTDAFDRKKAVQHAQYEIVKKRVRKKPARKK